MISKPKDGAKPTRTESTSKLASNLASDDKQINTCVDGEGTDVTVPKGRVFVTGDHRVGNYSMDSRNGDNRATLGTIPLEDIVGPVAMRIWPLNSIKFF